jgi:hypothetical protein
LLSFQLSSLKWYFWIRHVLWSFCPPFGLWRLLHTYKHTYILRYMVSRRYKIPFQALGRSYIHTYIYTYIHACMTVGLWLRWKTKLERTCKHFCTSISENRWNVSFRTMQVKNPFWQDIKLKFWHSCISWKIIGKYSGFRKRRYFFHDSFYLSYQHIVFVNILSIKIRRLIY